MKTTNMMQKKNKNMNKNKNWKEKEEKEKKKRRRQEKSEGAVNESGLGGVETRTNSISKR